MGMYHERTTSWSLQIISGRIEPRAADISSSVGSIFCAEVAAGHQRDRQMNDIMIREIVSRAATASKLSRSSKSRRRPPSTAPEAFRRRKPNARRRDLGEPGAARVAVPAIAMPPTQQHPPQDQRRSAALVAISASRSAAPRREHADKGPAGWRREWAARRRRRSPCRRGTRSIQHLQKAASAAGSPMFEKSWAIASSMSDGDPKPWLTPAAPAVRSSIINCTHPVGSDG